MQIWIVIIFCVLIVIIDIIDKHKKYKRMVELRIKNEELNEMNKMLYGKVCYMIGYKHAQFGIPYNYELCIKQIETGEFL